jgi:pre-rRNA-processing protein TSR4
MSSDNNEQPPRVQLGFSLPLHKGEDDVDAPDTSSFDGQEHNNILGHTSPNWCDWDGGKIGGLPSWLNPRDLPDGPLCCRGPCSKNIETKDGGTPLRFIAQLYCPADDVTNNPAAFHRSVYVFACPKCCSDSSKLFQHNEVDDGNDAKEIPAALLSECVRVLRCQLPKKNDFYPINGDGEENDEWEKHTSTFWSKSNKDDQLNLCAVCGQKSKGKCPKQGKWFCGPHHQKECLRASKQYQKTNPNEAMPQTYLPSVCYETELVVEEEPDHVPTAADNNSGNSNDTDTMNSKSLFQSGDITDADANLEQSDLNELTGNKSLAEAATGVTDPTTLAFYARMNIGGEENDVRDQCLRYSRWSTAQKPATDKDEGEEEEEEEGALWLSSDNRPDESFPPKCQHCGAERAFEFQILPQMIHYLLNDPDSSGDNNDATDNGRHVLTESERAVLLEAKAKIESGMELPEGFQEQHDLAVASARDALLGISRKGGDKSGTSEEEGAKDGLDWGTIAVYTCTASCCDSGKYLEEAAWVQPPLD